MAQVWRSGSGERAEVATPPHATVAALAARQFGVVTRAQLLAAGMSASAIKRRAADGRLQRLHPGVFAVGHAVLRDEGVWLAAVMAGGPGAVLSHRSAAAAWGLGPTSSTRIDITVCASRGRGRPGLAVHRCRLHPDETTRIDGIPVTTVARTLLDVAEVVPPRQLGRALERSVELRLFDRVAVEHVLERANGRRGVGPLRVALDELEDEVVTRSELEARALALLRSHGIARPAVNVRVAGYEVDLLWRAERVIVELDGHAFHSSVNAFERDRGRDADLQALGYRVLRFTWRHVTTKPEWVARRVAEVLRHGGVAISGR